MINFDVDAFIEDLQLVGRSCKTIKDYQYILKQFFLNCKKSSAKEVDVNDIRRFLTLVQPRFKANTYFIYVARLKTFFRATNPVVWDWMKKTLKIRIRETDISALTREQLFELSAFLGQRTRKQGWHLGETWQAIHWFLAATGCRIGEMCKLNMKDVVENPEEGVYEICFRGENTKTRRERTTFIPITGVVGRSLESYLLKYRCNALPNEPLFLNAWKQRFHPGRIDIKYQVAAKSLGIRTKCTPHVLRHTYCTMLQENNVDPKAASELTGHSVVTYLKIYGHPTEKRKQQITKTHQIV